MYSEHVRYAEQLRRFHEHFPAEQVLVLIYEEFRADNQATLRDACCASWSVDDGPTPRPGRHAAGEGGALAACCTASPRRCAGLAKTRPGRGAWRARPTRRCPSVCARRRVRAGWRRLVYAAPRPPDPQLMLELRRRFKPEVQAAGEYLGRDLVSLWGYEDID